MNMYVCLDAKNSLGKRLSVGRWWCRESFEEDIKVAVYDPPSPVMNMTGQLGSAVESLHFAVRKETSEEKDIVYCTLR